MILRFAMMAVLLGLAACAPQPAAEERLRAPEEAAVSSPEPPSPPLQAPLDRDPLDEGPDACGASRYQHLLGQPEASVRAANLPRPHRIICHNCPVTQDYAPSRLNVELDPQGRAARVFCG